MKTKLRMGSDHFDFGNKYILYLCFVSIVLGMMVSCEGKKSLTSKTTEKEQISVEDSTKTGNYDNYSHPYLKKAQDVNNVEGSAVAEEFYQAALSLFEKEDNLPGYAKTAQILSTNYSKKEDFERAFNLLRTALKKWHEFNDENNSITADLYNKIGRCFYNTNESDSALIYYNKCLKIRENLYHENHPKLADINYRIGHLYQWRIEDYYNAEKYYSKELTIRINNEFSTDVDFIYCYYNLAVSNRNIKDLKKAELYAHKALDFISKTDSSNTAIKKRCYNVLANIYNLRERYNEAKYYYNQAIKLAYDNSIGTLNSLALYYNNLGSVYRKLNDPATALQYYNKALVNYEKTNDQFGLADTYNKFGFAHKELQQLDSANIYLKKYLNTTLNHYGSKHPRTSKAYTILARHLLSQEVKLDSILAIVHLGLIAGIEMFDNPDPLVNPALKTLSNNFDLITTLEIKGTVITNLAKLNNNNVDLLRIALNNYLLADSLITVERNNFNIDHSRLYLAKSYKSIYEKSLECTYQLFLETKDDLYNKIAFQFMEKSKSRLLSENLDKVELLNQAGVSKEVKDQEIKFKTAMAFLNASLKVENEKINPNKQKINRINQELFSINEKQDSLKSYLESKYPQYFKIKYKQFEDQLEYLSTKLKNKNLIEYFWGDSAVYALRLSSKIFKFHKFSLDYDFFYEFNNYLRLIGNPDYLLMDSTIIMSHQLYSKLLAPLIGQEKNEGKNKELIIIPDGPLAYLPFETMISSVNNNTNFVNANFLILNWAVSYSYSVDLLFADTFSKLNNRPNVLALSYTDNNQNILPDHTSGNLSQLFGTAKEIDALKQLMDGEFLKGENATEKKFKELAYQYDILHLAIHGAASKGDSIDAKLYFQSTLEEKEDGILYPYELYNLNLNALLVVLSACETGIGTYKKGEGVFSMARGFAYAGCPSVVMSLWKVNDLVASKVMKSFYEYLNEGDEITIALRKAKLDYLNSADELTAHPYHWAAFVPIGNTEPIIRKSNYFFIWIGSGFFAIILLYTLIFKRKLKKTG